MIDVSIVSGTYNRLPVMQAMVESIRQSVSYLSYEIVLVDGGSQDGTQEWCKSQDDIRLIEQGKLLGAVKAFNEGAFAAKGTYIVLANDDIEFLGSSILNSFIYMQNHSDCGVGCFYQDRDGRDWHVDKMSCVRDKQQTSEYYGQVCIIPKWLGDHIGWWGDYLHTYGGDNELSSKVYEEGFRVEPVPGTRIHDKETEDDLRKINNVSGAKDPRAVMGHHPDSWAWGQRWRRQINGKWFAGPIIKEIPTMNNPIQKKDRVLYLPIFEQGWAVQKEQKRGLREALQQVALVEEYDYMDRNSQVNKETLIREVGVICNRLQPTLILTQLHDTNIINPNDIQVIRQYAPQATIVNWNGDVYPDNLLSEKGIALAKAVDLQTSVNMDAVEQYQELGINAEYWQIGFEPDGVGHKPNVFNDVVFLAGGYSNERQEFVKKIREWGFDFGLYGQGWPDGWAKGQNLYNFVEACRVYRGAKISLGDSQWPETGFVSNRVFQAIAAGGAALAHQWFRGMEDLGLKDGDTCIVWYTFEDLREKIEHYLGNDSDRQRVAINGERLAYERHSFDVRVKELFEMIKVKDEVVNWR